MKFTMKYDLSYIIHGEFWQSIRETVIVRYWMRIKPFTEPGTGGIFGIYENFSIAGVDEINLRREKKSIKYLYHFRHDSLCLLYDRR